MNKPMVYVISGKQGSGKTTLAEMLLKHLGPEARVYKFADILYELHNMIRNYMRALGIERPEKDGPLLQLLGTEWGRNTIDENIWPKILYSRVEKDAAKIILIDDCRFPNEFDMTRETYGKNCLMVRLECPEEIRKARCPAWRPNTEHPSETGLDEYARLGKFDIYYETDKMSAEQCMSDLAKQIQLRLPK